jgi:polar amino acid transport system permease protein
LSSDIQGLIGRRLAPSERYDWRLVLGIAGALIVLLSYFLPMFPNRIVQATTLFSGGSTKEADFAVLISGQHYTQTKHPLEETLQDVRLTVAPARGHNGSGWGWLLQILRQAGIIKLLSYVICLGLPLLCALVVLLTVGLAWFSEGGLSERLIIASINLAILAPVSLFLAWEHQFDFSTLLFSLARSALMPRIGFWVALVGMALMLVSAFSLRRQTPRPIVNWWALVFVAALGIWLLIPFKPFPFLEIWRFILDGIGVTLRISATSFGFILLVSLFGGLGRISRARLINGLASLYVELVRGIPLLVQLLFIWFALPQVFDGLGEALKAASPSLEGYGQWLTDLRMDPFTAAVLGLTICYGAYGSEIFRAGISSIHHGQMEAARSLGMTYVQAMRYIILPQAVRVILPPLGNEFVALLKDSSLVSVLAVSDLTRRGREYMASTFLSFDTWIMVALCYLVLTLFASRIVEFIESKSKFER